MQNNEKENSLDKVNEFIQKNRKIIFISIGIVVFLFVGMVAYLYLSDNANKKEIAELDDLNRRFTDLHYFISQGIDYEDVDTLADEIEAFALKPSPLTFGKGIAKGRAWSLLGQIYSGKKEWEKSEEAWLNAAITGNNTYIGPIALFNVAVSAEEQGNKEQAIEFLEQCVSHKFEFPSAARAQFNIGRLHEELGNYDEALIAYRDVLINHSNMPVFQHLARNQITKLEM